eukprot:TRINITY_DN58166_c0_g1_i1.p2 TRINITY_DN58166_c0_g1~~TRINITY_DN58166_c0_g1_i1.p2  ORF type:complete len:200 (+),score=21.52 TRINITY_DN58166_c0_g1_i1:546-1145(+)
MLSLFLFILLLAKLALLIWVSIVGFHFLLSTPTVMDLLTRVVKLHFIMDVDVYFAALVSNTISNIEIWAKFGHLKPVGECIDSLFNGTAAFHARVFMVAALPLVFNYGLCGGKSSLGWSLVMYGTVVGTVLFFVAVCYVVAKKGAILVMMLLVWFKPKPAGSPVWEPVTQEEHSLLNEALATPACAPNTPGIDTTEFAL